MIVNIDLSQEIFAIDMLRVLKSSLKHRRKHDLGHSTAWRDIYSKHQDLIYFAVFKIRIFHSVEKSSPMLEHILDLNRPRQVIEGLVETS